MTKAELLALLEVERYAPLPPRPANATSDGPGAEKEGSMTTCIRRPHSVWTTCPCDTCTLDRRRLHKRHRAGLYHRVPSDQARDTLRQLRDAGWSAHAIASATGLHYRSVDRDLTATRIGPSIAAKIINHGDPTAGSVGATGTMRRLQGLALHGYDLQTISDATSIGFTTLAAIRQGKTQRVRSSFYTTIRDYAADVDMTMGPSTAARAHAQRQGWPGLLAWDDIESPAERPKMPRVKDASRSRTSVDEAVVTRVLAGEKLPTTPAEKAEILRRWATSGRSATTFAAERGWKSDRYWREAS